MWKHEDPRDAPTLDEAARNPDGTYNLFRALSWVTKVIRAPVGGFSEQTMREIWEEAKRRNKDGKR